MSTRVYLSKHTCQTTHEEETPVCLRIQLSRATVEELHRRLQHAYQRDDLRLVRRITVLLDLLVHQVPVEVLSERWRLSISCLYQWRQAFLLRGMDSLGYHYSGGRRPKLTPRQKNRLVELVEARPLVVGCETAWWTSRTHPGAASGGSSACSTTANTCVHGCTTWAFRFKRRVLSRTHLDAASVTPGSRRNGR